MRDDEMPSAKRVRRASRHGSSAPNRASTAFVDAMPQLCLKRPPSGACSSMPGASIVPANHEPIITELAPAASASATSRG